MLEIDGEIGYQRHILKVIGNVIRRISTVVISVFSKVGVVCLFMLLIEPISAVESSDRAFRLNGGKPVISHAMFAERDQQRRGNNINGPSLVKVPDWVAPHQRADPNAKYYLYFANHGGKEINMAWAPAIEGPYTLYNVGPRQKPGVGGVLEMGKGLKIELDHSLSIYGHIASPEVLVDDENRYFVMYFHGPAAYGGKRLKGQRTFVATSKYGLNFNSKNRYAGDPHGVRSILLGKSYFRVFGVDDALYAISNGGVLYRARSSESPWRPPENFDFRENLWERREKRVEVPGQPRSNAHIRYRHFAILKRDEETLNLFYTRKGDAPERIMHSVLDVSGSWENWPPIGPPETVLLPEMVWEGAMEPMLPSKGGPPKRLMNQLRDPYIYQELGKTYLFYAGGGEKGIGLAILNTSAD